MGSSWSQQPLGNVEGADNVKKKMERILASCDVPEAQRQIEDLLSEWENTPLNICVVGKRGVGKSSFINNMAGEMLARVGRTETTSEAESYTHPHNQKLSFWDLPGFGARFYPTITEYLKKMQLSRFDVILYLYKDGFEQTDKEMYGKIFEIGKPMFLVRSKFDNDVQGGADIETEKRSIDAELEEYGIPLPQNRDQRCYFIANRTQEQPTCYLYDYEKLMEDINECLNDSKRQALLFTLQNPNKKLLDLKKKQLEGRIWIAATKACVYGAIPIPGCDVLLNTGIVIQEIGFMAKVLGIMGDIESYKHNANNPEFSEVKLQCLQRCANYLCLNSFLALVKTFGVGVTLVAADELLKFIPGLGSLVSSSVSFAVTHRVLTKVLDDFIYLANVNMANEHAF